MIDASLYYGILQIQGPGSGQRPDEHPLVKPAVEIGRSGDCDLVLDDPRVSRRHARLSYTAQGFQVQDLGSANGTLVNGQPLPPRRPCPLRPGDIIQVGSFQLAIRLPTPEQPWPPVIGERLRISARPQPGLAVYAEGRLLKFPLDKPQVTLGRQDDNDLVVPAKVVSGHHARLEWIGHTYRILDLGSTNGLVYDGQRVPGKDLADDDMLYITDQVAIRYLAAVGLLPVVEKEQEVVTQRLPTDDQPVRIGRAKDNQISLDHPQVSRYHAIVERMGVGRYRIRDLKSTNGVFVNNKRIDNEAWLKEGDTIRIGPFPLDLREGGVRQLADTGGMRMDATGLQKWVSKEKNLLQNISLSIYPQEFVALVGLSGAGKSTLMNAMNGFWPATNGTVLVNDIDLYRNFDLFRNELGYVPQKDIVHAELTVYQALDYAAQLRMPADTAAAERKTRIEEVLDDLDLVERKDLPIHKLSGGQLKRVSIGVELLTKPRLFFLDEPTSGLDPGTEYNMMKLLRRLADQGRTVVLITHATKNVMMCDKVIFLVRGGHVAYYGPPEEALVYFDRYRTDQERREKDMEFDNIYIVLEDDSRGSPKEWAERYQQSPEYQKYVVQRLQERKRTAPTPAATPTAARRRIAGGAARRISGVRQLIILSSRNLNILARDKLSLALMLLLAPAIGLMDFMWKRTLFDPVKGEPNTITTMLFMAGLISILTGALSSVLQIVKEVDIYKRERAVGLKVGPYVLSKIWIGVILAFYQALVFLVFKLIFVNPQLPGPEAYLAIYITLFLGTLSGYLFGLTISAAAPNLNVAILLVIVVLVPQFLFAGALLPLDLIPGGEQISIIASTRWSFEAMVNITGIGKIMADDPCWDDRPQETEGDLEGWDAMLKKADAEKRAAGCLCMGSAIFETCNKFPGILSTEFYDDPAKEALNQAEPVEPIKPTAFPSPTPYPSPTPLPTPSDLRNMDAYMDDSRDQGDQYQDLRQVQGDEYQVQREEQGDAYADAMKAYGDDKEEWTRNREQAIKGAEGLLKAVFKGNWRSFRGTVVIRWVWMIVIMVVLVGLILFFQKRKDVI